MTDRELLEAAAKAAGLVWHNKYDFQFGAEVSFPHQAPFIWNPLTNDGDAFRLWVVLRMEVNHGNMFVGAGSLPDKYFTQKYLDDPYAATRRAIVRAAAEIGSRRAAPHQTAYERASSGIAAEIEGLLSERKKEPE